MSAQGTVKLHVYGSSNAEYRDTLAQFRASIRAAVGELP